MINEPGKRSRGRWEILYSVSLYRERAELCQQWTENSSPGLYLLKGQKLNEFAAFAAQKTSISNIKLAQDD